MGSRAEYCREWRKRNAERLKAERKENREERRKYAREYKRRPEVKARTRELLKLRRQRDPDWRRRQNAIVAKSGKKRYANDRSYRILQKLKCLRGQARRAWLRAFDSGKLGVFACLYCGRPYWPKVVTQKVCSKLCRGKRLAEEISRKRHGGKLVSQPEKDLISADKSRARLARIKLKQGALNIAADILAIRAAILNR